MSQTEQITSRLDGDGKVKGGLGHGFEEELTAQEKLQDFALLMRAVTQVDGISSAVFMASAATAHRYTGVYRFDDDLLTNLCTWDREEGCMTSGGCVLVHQSFCMHILQSGKAFTVVDSLSDSRLAGHPKRTEFRSYCGAPLLNRRGEVAGTFCHYDPEPNKLGEADFEQVHIAAAVLQEHVLPAT